ncbi:Putative transcription factor IIIC, 90kDa subunit, transcription factor IIIC zinc-finger [Septoria linicola]|uniref:Transcription factor IIIC, 90kDa subunit, transcription factor IIIC zinc-finger n=1 Tax=Septoria linicola TaxID=215465 RepID=A0A9Q9B3C3_9PEZI|nr:putative transcription factor IIIC, 90kDa subunit, transcription factor IIIC zinc-finger [Septoria linicola]USW56481.1 Putative transcription factor IIIC, 90kDa subunit, transcription factor IIIC zinc-finger [Septoria linicola]
MACTLTVPFWPTSYDNLHWSRDNRLAVLGGEHILILTPRLKEPTPGRLWWDTENLIRINAFTTAEIPRAAVLSDLNTSIGEELSVFQVHAAAWSPSGLAKHGDCGLAVLTTNHVLSIWSTETKGKETPAWTRTVVINHAVRRFYEDQAADRQEGNEDARDRYERLQVQQRVRAFEWLPPIYSDLERSHPALFTGSQSLVVATEGGHLLLVHVSSPHNDRLSGEQSWSAVVIDCLAVVHAASLLEANGEQLPDIATAMPKPHPSIYIGADHVAAGDWQQDKNSEMHCLALVFVFQGKLFSTMLRHDVNGVPSFAPPSAVRWHVREHADMTGPLQITPGTDAGCLTAFANDLVLHGQLAFDTKDQNVVLDAQSHHLDERWDDVSGSLITSNPTGGSCLHIISHLSTSTAPTHALRLPLSSEDGNVESAWHFALATSKAAYGATYDLGENVQERTWGIASAPIGGYLATCASMHPNDVVAYVINAEQTSVLNITLEPDIRVHPSELQPGTLGAFTGLPSGTVLFFLMRYLERKAEEDTDAEHDHYSLAKTVRGLLSAENYADEIDLNNASDTLEMLLGRLKIYIFANAEVRHAQAIRICDLAGGASVLRAECMVTIIRHIAGALLAIQHTLIELNALSMNVKRIYDVALSKLDSNFKLGSFESSARDWSEECKICHQSIAFESFKWARCQQGHQFGRCALSLLAIQEPGTTKQCGVCNLQYLDETAVAEFMPASQDLQMVDVPEGEVSRSTPANDMWVEISRGGDATARSTTTLARLLFAACDVCIYCGGRFKD